MTYWPDERIMQFNIVKKHISGMTKAQVLDCLQIVVDEFKDDQQHEQKRKAQAVEYIAWIENSDVEERVGFAKTFLKYCHDSCVFFESERFLDVGGYVEKIHRVGKPVEVREKREKHKREVNVREKPKDKQKPKKTD